MRCTEGAMALRLITDHLAECASERRDTKNAIKDVRNLLLGFIASVFAVVITFTGYTYVQAQTLAQQLAATRAQTASQISEIPGKTAQAVSDIAGPSIAPKQGN